MASYKEPALQDRLALAAQARQKALDRLKSKPPVDPEVAAQRRAAAEAREAAASEKRAAKLAEKQRIEDEKAAIIAAKEAEIAAAAAAVIEAEAARLLSMPTAAEMKAARDARYAARKNRK